MFGCSQLMTDHVCECVYLCFYFKLSFVQMKRLKLKSVKNIDVATHLSHCIHQIEELRLGACTITEKGFAALVDQIRQLAKPVKYCGVLY